MTPGQRLLAYALRVRWSYLVGGVVTLAYAGLFQFVPLAVRDLVHVIERGGTRAEVRAGVAWLIAVSVLFAGLRLLSRISLFRTGREIEYELRNDIFAHLQRLPQSYFAARRTGDLMSRAVNDIQSIRMFLGMGILNIIQTPVLYLGAIGVMFAIDWTLALYVVLPYPLFVAIGRVFGRRMHRASLVAQEQLGALSTVAQENAAGVLVVRSYAMEERTRQLFARDNEALYRSHVRLAVVGAAMQPIVGLLPAIAMILVLYVGGLRVQSGAMSQSDLWAFFTYIFMLSFPTFMMGFVIALVQRGLASLGRIGEILDVVPTIRDAADAARLERVAGRVEFAGLDYNYPERDRRPALRGVRLLAEPGETIGVVGPVGSGKSTLVSAIPRLLELPDERVRVDGIDVKRIPLRLLRSAIAMVPQESFLFSASVRDNIAFGCPDAALEEVREAAQRAHILEEIEALPQGFDTPVGERGITLSGGQRQRVALARALILDPAILILDDALSSVDALTEEAILKELRTARAGRTCFIVAHRLTAVRDADRVVVLDAGEIAEEGAPEELLRRDGLYARLWRQQQLEAELEADA